MNRRKSLTPRQLAREKILFRYSTALEHGDFDALKDILREAEGDPILEKMIWEINEVYRAELPVATPSLNRSLNHNHRNTREDESMTIYTNPNRLSRTDTRSTRRISVTLAAAMLALVVFSAALLMLRKPIDPQEDNLAALQAATDTLTPLATFTPTSSFTPTVVSAEAINRSVLCQGSVLIADGIDVLSRPSYNAVAIGHLPLGTQVDILDQEWHSDESPSAWFFVSGTVDDIVLQGWISVRYLSFTDDCPPPSELLSAQASEMAQAMTVLPPCILNQPTLTFTPTPASEFIDSRDLTATAIVVWATGTVQAATFSPTSVPFGTSGEYGQPCAEAASAVPCGSDTQSFIVILPSPTPNPLMQPIEGTSTAVVVYATASVAAMTAFPTVVPPSDYPCIITATPVGFVNIPPGATPTAGLDAALRSGGYNLVTLENVGNIPAGTLVQLTSAYFDGTHWIYTILTQDGLSATVAEGQLAAVVGQSSQPSTTILVPSPTFTATPTPSQ